MKAYLLSYGYYDEVIPIFATTDADKAINYRRKFNNILAELILHNVEQYRKGYVNLEKKVNMLNLWSNG
jgi:hypothetical protein